MQYDCHGSSERSQPSQVAAELNYKTRFEEFNDEALEQGAVGCQI